MPSFFFRVVFKVFNEDYKKGVYNEETAYKIRA